VRAIRETGDAEGEGLRRVQPGVHRRDRPLLHWHHWHRGRAAHEDPLQLAVWSAHPLAERDEIDLSELDGDALIEMPRDQWPEWHDFLHDLLRARGACTHTIAQATTAHSALGLVAARVGVCVLSGEACRLEPPGVMFVSITGASVTLALARRAGVPSMRIEQLKAETIGASKRLVGPGHVQG
jgi:DNA-binding transcriptional LysR family regulator